jgi:hypothetical protein
MGMQIEASYKRYMIDAKNSTHVAWWAEMLGVTEDALLAAIERVGNGVQAIQAYLSTHKAPQSAPLTAGPRPPAQDHHLDPS